MVGVPPLPPGGYTGPPYAPPPPGYLAHGTYVPTQRFEPFGGLATAATALLGVMAVLALFGLGNALGLAGWVTFPDEDEVSVLADLEDFVADATLADRMVAAGFVITATAAILAAVMVQTLSRRQTARASALAAAAIGWRLG